MTYPPGYRTAIGRYSTGSGKFDITLIEETPATPYP